MATIKQLQDNFTTPEQSKRLLELGVPADSADMRYRQECIRMQCGEEECEYFLRYGKPDTSKYSTDIPSWSVGRLIEIMSKLISSGQHYIRVYVDTNIIDNVAGDIEREIELGYIDFSKLEEQDKKQDKKQDKYDR